MKGGGSLPRPLPREATADLFARAIIAAAGVYGDDPVAACLPGSATQARRALTAAAGGITLALDCATGPVTRVLGVGRSTVFTARCKKQGAYLAAELAAKRAAEFATWRPEAAESRVAGAGPEALAPGHTDLMVTPESLDDWLATIPPEQLARDLGVGTDDDADLQFDALGHCAQCKAEGSLNPRGLCVDCFEQLPDAPVADDANAVRTDPPLSLPPAPKPQRPALELTTTAPRALVPAEIRPVTSPYANTVAGLVLDALAAGETLNSMSLAYRVDRKEMVVVGALKQLEADGLVRCEPVTGGARAFAWTLVEGAQ